MTLAEFKAWFEGYTEGMDEKAPSLKQWKRIQAKVAEIDGTAITYPIYIERYVEPIWRPSWPSWSPYWVSGGSTGMPTIDTTPVFNSTAAMYALGRAEAMN